MGHREQCSMSVQIVLDDLTVAYRRHPALHHVSGRFEGGSLTAVIGPNGAGKTTLLKAIMGLLALESGRIEQTPEAPRIAYMPQQSEIDRGFPISVRDCVLLGYWQEHGLLRRLTPEHIAQAEAALNAVGLEGFSQRSIGTLSAGQFQRMLFARLYLQDAALILLDEPFNAIDARTTAELIRLIRHWHAEGRTIITVVHDYELVREYFPQTLLLARHPIAWGDTATTLTRDHLWQAGAMAEAWDEAAAPCVTRLVA
jgi:zinc/manganese transport system ATP-binding protein